MTPERWRRTKQVLEAAWDWDKDAPERSRFLDLACDGDPQLRSDVEDLLASDENASKFLAAPAIAAAQIDEDAAVGATAAARAGEPVPNGSGQTHTGAGRNSIQTLIGKLANVVRPTRILGSEDRAAASTSNQTSLILNDRYEIERELGRGGMSVVYLARDRQLLAKRVVIKVLLAESNLDPWIRQKFSQEMEALSRIDHPGVVGVLDTGLTAERRQFLVMQYIEGETLRAVIKSGMSFARAAGIIRQAGQALAAAHEKGVWHRDLKPENIMVQSLGGEDHVKLIDFGIAGIQNSQFSGEQTKIAGSFAYMAPEQLDGRACAASDTYALGVVSYEMLTGVRPGPSGELRQELPRAVDASIRRATATHPDLRHATVREFTEELYHALTGGEPGRRTAVPGAVEMANVLFTDLVGYSLLPMDQQKEYLGELQQIVRESAQFRAAEATGDIVSLPTGDGMALAFFGDPTAPAQCALEVAAGLKSKPYLKLRMGIHTGPVYRVNDVNANVNVAGGGINTAQRVMDCGDAGHILLSKSTADVLVQLSQWASYLTDLGECTVKHGVKMHLCNLATPELGNPAKPRKLAVTSFKAKSRVGLVAALTLVVIGTSGVLWFGKIGRSPNSTREEPSIAVLPFEDLSPGKDQQYFSEGLADELSGALTRTAGLRVLARHSAFKFTRNQDVRIIGKKLNAAHILEGSVRTHGNRVRITVLLIRASDGVQVWSNTYNEEMSDILAVQESIARALTTELGVKLLAGQGAPFRKSLDPEVHNLYFQGRYFLERRSKDNLDRAAGYFEQATKLDSNYAPAWVGLGETRSNQAGSGYYPPRERYQLARDAVQRALALNPESGEAHSALGWIQMNGEWDWDGADASFKKALALAPGNALIISHAAILSRILGRLDEATARGRRAIHLDPENFGSHLNAGVSFYYAGLNDDATVAFRKALELVPEAEIAHFLLGTVCLAQSEAQKALAEMEKEKHAGFRQVGLALAYHALGRKLDSDAKLEELTTKNSKARYQIAELYAFRGNADLAFEYLDREYEARGTGFAQFKGDPLMKSLERDRRYAALLKKLRLPL